MKCESEDAITAEGCNQAHEQRSGSYTPGNSNPELTSEGVTYRNTVVEELAALDARHNPGCDKHLNEPLQFVGDGANRIQGRPLLEREYLWKNPVRQEPESHENPHENEKTPTGAQATEVEEEFSHIVDSLRLKFLSPF